ncbi:MAG: hypothetical protein R2809_11060 [Flavobacteriales bacterium]
MIASTESKIFQSILTTGMMSVYSDGVPKEMMQSVIDKEGLV